MMSFKSLLFNGKKPLVVPQVVGAKRVVRQREKLLKILEENRQGFERIEKDAQKMKIKIDTALATAITTGGLHE